MHNEKDLQPFITTNIMNYAGNPTGMGPFGRDLGMDI